MHITFLHTAQTHIETFASLLTAVDDTISHTHLVKAELLERARREGETAVLQSEIEQTINAALAEYPDGLLLCTCSTIGKLAETVAPKRVLRVDRPMMAEAMRIGGTVHIVATVESTIEPTLALLNEVADDMTLTVQLTVVPEAWVYFEQGDVDGYHRAIAKKLVQLAPKADVIILAQASMAGATHYCDVTTPILSSPEIGIREAVRRLKAVQS